MLWGKALAIVRYNRICKLLHRNYGSIAKSKLKEFLADHVNYPESIYRYRHSSDPKSARRTIAVFVMDPTEGKILVADGNPCQARFYEYQV